jgi:hypothetical protein
LPIDFKSFKVGVTLSVTQCGDILAITGSPDCDNAFMTSCRNELLVAWLRALVEFTIHEHYFEIFDLLDIDVSSFSIKFPNTSHLVT